MIFSKSIREAAVLWLLTLVILALATFSSFAAWSVDTTFASTLNLPNMRVVQGFEQSSGKVVLEVEYSCTVGGATVLCTRLVRMNLNGTIDGSFQPARVGNSPGQAFGPDTPSSFLRVAGMQSSGKLIIYGQFLSINLNTLRPFIARLGADGAYDPSFQVSFFPQPAPCGGMANPPCNPPNVTCLYPGDPGCETVKLFSNPPITLGVVKAHPSQSILMTGNFTMVNNVARPGLAMINLNGGTEPFPVAPITFAGSYPQGNSVKAVDFRPGGWVLGGDFSTVNGVGRKGLVGFTQGMTLDTGFNAANGIDNTMIGNQPTVIREVRANPFNGEVFIAGNFNKVSGSLKNNNAALKPDGTFNGTGSWGTTYQFPSIMDFTSTKVFTIQPAGLGGTSTQLIDVDANGVKTVLITAIGKKITFVKTLSSGKLLIGGTFTSLGGSSAPRLVLLKP